MKDPMKGFRGVVSAMLVLEAIVVLLGVLLVSRRAEISTGEVWAVVALGVVLIALCGVVGKPWALGAIWGAQALLVLGFFIDPAIGVVGVLFCAGWGWITWMRNDVLKRMAEGRLPGQQQPPPA